MLLEFDLNYILFKFYFELCILFDFRLYVIKT